MKSTSSVKVEDRIKTPGFPDNQIQVANILRISPIRTLPVEVDFIFFQAVGIHCSFDAVNSMTLSSEKSSQKKKISKCESFVREIKIFERNSRFKL